MATLKGTVRRILPKKGFGFLATSDGTEYFFHQSACVDIRFDESAKGSRSRSTWGSAEGAKSGERPACVKTVIARPFALAPLRSPRLGQPGLFPVVCGTNAEWRCEPFGNSGPAPVAESGSNPHAVTRGAGAEPARASGVDAIVSGGQLERLRPAYFFRRSFRWGMSLCDTDWSASRSPRPTSTA